VGAVSLLALGVNGIVGVGIFFAPADVARGAPGTGSILVFAATAVALVPVAVVFAVLGRRFDEDGGPVVFARAAFGELPSFVVGWIAYVSAIASTAAVTAGLTSAVAPTFGIRGELAERLTATVLLTALALVCAAGIRLSAQVWTTLTVLKLVPLVALAGAFLLAGAPGPAPTAAAAPTGSLIRAVLTATFAYQGFEVVPVIAGEVRSPYRIVAPAVAGSLAVAAVLYVLLQSASVAALPNLASSAAPLAEAAAVFGGASLSRLVQIGTSISALGIAMGMVATTPRYLSSLAAGSPLALHLERMAANGVPLRALAATWLLVGILLLGGTRGELFALSSVAVLMQYVVAALSLLELGRRRERGLDLRKAWSAIPAIVVGLAIVTGGSAREWVVAAAALLVGLVLRWATRTRR
jgi:basic amino acid/polyamine antiporter, APA family